MAVYVSLPAASWSSPTPVVWALPSPLDRVHGGGGGDGEFDLVGLVQNGEGFVEFLLLGCGGVAEVAGDAGEVKRV